MNSDAHFDFGVGQLERRVTDGGHGARRQRDAHAAGCGVDAPRDIGDVGQALALLGGGARDLLDQHSRADTAPARGEGAVLHGDVVVDDDRFDGDALGIGEFGGHLEVHHIAGVVLHDVQHACAAVDVLGGLQHLVGHR